MAVDHKDKEYGEDERLTPEQEKQIIEFGMKQDEVFTQLRQQLEAAFEVNSDILKVEFNI